MKWTHQQYDSQPLWLIMNLGVMMSEETKHDKEKANKHK